MPANPSFSGYIISSGRQVVASFKTNFHVQLCQIRFSHAIWILKCSLTFSAMKNGSSLPDFTGGALRLSWSNSLSLPIAKQGKGRSGGESKYTGSILAFSCLCSSWWDQIEVCSCSEHSPPTPQNSAVCSVASVCLECVLDFNFLSCWISDMHQRDNRSVSCCLSAPESRATVIAFHILKH